MRSVTALGVLAVGAMLAVPASAGRTSVAGPLATYEAIAHTRPIAADTAGYGGYSYDAAVDADQPATTDPFLLHLDLNVPEAVARRRFVGQIVRGFTDAFTDGPVVFVIARSPMDAAWFAGPHKAGLGSSAATDSRFNSPGTVMYDEGGTPHAAVAVRGSVVVFSLADSGPAEIDALLHIGLRYLARAERT